jgi:hypothetical protein
VVINWVITLIVMVGLIRVVADCSANADPLSDIEAKTFHHGVL